MPPTSVEFRDRASGRLVREPIEGERLMRWLYETPLGFKALHLFVVRPALSNLFGWWMSQPRSAKGLPGFVARCGIKLEEAEHPLEAYGSFNAFFERKLKPEARPWDPDPAAFCSPGDGKVLVYPTLGELPVKGAKIDAAELLRDPAAAARYAGGAALVLRLAPYDYHRFHFPVAGTAGPARLVPGFYHSVNPIALAVVPEVFLINKRMVTELHSPLFGRIALVEVGAVNVGTIAQTFAPGPVEKGQEKGTFRFGGSTVVVLFEPGRIAFDPDLLADSRAGIEVQVLAGQRLGTASAAGRP
jgi:phosphatidylserine decarboxylase